MIDVYFQQDCETGVYVLGVCELPHLCVSELVVLFVAGVPSR